MTRLLICVTAFLGGTLAFGQNNFPEASPAHAGYKAYVRLWARGLVPRPGHRMSGPSAAEVASYLIKGVDDLRGNLGAQLKQLQVANSNLPVGNYYYDVNLFAGGMFEDFRLAINSHRPEIRALGRDPGKLLARVDATRPIATKIADLLASHLPTKPFRDLPKSHWAWAAAQELKDEGILTGYPNGD